MLKLTPEEYFWKEKLKQIYKKRYQELQMQLDILEAHTRRMEDAICEWCRMSGWAVESWKQQPQDARRVKMKTAILVGDCVEMLKHLPDGCVNCCVTSPPYFGLRDYGVDGQIGLEQTPDEYVAKMVEVFREVRRVLRDDGTLWLNLGDSYSGSGKGVWDAPEERKIAVKETYRPSVNPVKVQTGLKPKDLIGIPWRVAFALQQDGWYLRQDIIWHKPNPMPESVKDRCTKAHEYIFLLSKSPKYWFDSEAIKEPAIYAGDNRGARGDKRRGTVSGVTGEFRNKRSVWTVTTKPFKGAHFATFPPDLIEPCVLAGCPEGGLVLDPFGGSGTTGMVANQHGRNAVLTELNPEYAEIATSRIASVGGEVVR